MKPNKPYGYAALVFASAMGLQACDTQSNPDQPDVITNITPTMAPVIVLDVDEFFISNAGGSLEQCDGLSRADYSEDANGECALNHINELIHPGHGAESEGLYRGGFDGGDIITVLNNSDGSQAEYKMGYFKKYEYDGCDGLWPYGCGLANLPSGAEGYPTTIRGEDYQNCETPALLWGHGRLDNMFTIKNAKHINFQCLEITDKSSCTSVPYYDDASLICRHGEPFTSEHVGTGIYMEDVENLLVKDVNIHGIAKGIHAGRIGHAVFDNLTLFANSYAASPASLKLKFVSFNQFQADISIPIT
jgi:hypothetical protein